MARSGEWGRRLRNGLSARVTSIPIGAGVAVLIGLAGSIARGLAAGFGLRFASGRDGSPPRDDEDRPTSEVAIGRDAI